mgnify:CR=1 FL=1
MDRLLATPATTRPPEPEFRGAALEAQALTDPEWMMAGPSETGKTVATLYRLDSLARQWPGSQLAIVRKVRADMDGTVLQLFRQHYAREEYGVETFGGEKPEWFGYPDGARIWVGGMDRPGKVLSGARDAVYVNQAEELDLGDWETLTTRTTGRAGVIPTPMLFGDCNPGPASHWILRRAGLRVLHSRHEDNPTLYTAAGQLTERGRRTMAVLDALTGVRKERLRHGRWVNAEGAVYEFNPAVHEIAWFQPPSEWRHFRVIDFGYSNPFVCQWWAVDPDGRMYLYREIYMSQRTVRVHAGKILAGDDGAPVEATVADHDAEDRATLAESGIRTERAIKDISRGIQAVQDRLKIQGDGRPRLFVMRGALLERDERLAEAHRPTCTREEFDVYMWPKDEGGRAVKEAPVKKDDHGMDALRYAVMYADQSASAGAFVMRYR